MPLAVQLHEDDDEELTLVVSVLVGSDQREMGLAFLTAVENYPNFYRGQVITVDEDGNPAFLAVPAVSVDDVVLDPATWEELRRQMIDFVGMESAFRAARLPFRRGVILAGPPGVGKTLVFRALTGHLVGRCTVLWLTSRAINYPVDVARLFEFARSVAPTLMLLEDLDLIVRDRRNGRPAILGELLSQLDGPASSDGVIACASTNDASVLDEALSTRPSRFDRIISVGLPSREARLGMLHRFVSDVPNMHADLDWVAGQTAHLTGADLRELVVTAFAESQRYAGSGESSEAGVTAPEAVGSLETVHFVRALEQLAAANAAARQSGVRGRRLGYAGQFGFTRTRD